MLRRRVAKTAKTYRCPQCDAGAFDKWGRCLQHLKAEKHGDLASGADPSTKEGRRKLQEICLVKSSAEDDDDTPRPVSLDGRRPTSMDDRLVRSPSSGETSRPASVDGRRMPRGYDFAAAAAAAAGENERYACFKCQARFETWAQVDAHFKSSPSCLGGTTPDALSSSHVRALRRACALSTPRPRSLERTSSRPSSFGSTTSTRGTRSGKGGISDLPESIIAYLNLFLTVEETFNLYEAIVLKDGQTGPRSTRSSSRVSDLSEDETAKRSSSRDAFS